MHQIDVAETRAIWRRSNFAWGTHDCILAACDHVERTTGIDPAKPWRGSYHDEAGAKAIYEQHGGVLALFNHGMSLAGFERGDSRVGAVVIAKVMGAEVVGVDFGAMVGFVHPERGLTEVRLPIIAAWPL
jgi:hypothetical protein